MDKRIGHFKNGLRKRKDVSDRAATNRMGAGLGDGPWNAFMSSPHRASSSSTIGTEAPRAPWSGLMTSFIALHLVRKLLLTIKWQRFRGAPLRSRRNSKPWVMVLTRQSRVYSIFLEAHKEDSPGCRWNCPTKTTSCHSNARLCGVMLSARNRSTTAGSSASRAYRCGYVGV